MQRGEEELLFNLAGLVAPRSGVFARAYGRIAAFRGWSLPSGWLRPWAGAACLVCLGAYAPGLAMLISDCGSPFRAGWHECFTNAMEAFVRRATKVLFARTC